MIFKSDKKKGKVKQKFAALGTVTNWMDLQDFPFDSDIITILGSFFSIFLILLARPNVHTENVMKFQVNFLLKTKN